MSGVQTAVTTAPAVGVAGMPYDDQKISVDSLVATEAIPFGAYVKCGEGVCSLPSVTGDIANGGIALTDGNKSSGGSAYGPQGYQAGDIVSVLKRGKAWVKAEQALAAQTKPFVRFVAGTGTRGGIRADADTANAVQANGTVVFRGTTTPGNLIVIDVDFPNG